MMPSILYAGSEGEISLFDNTLNPVGADDKRRGAVLVDLGQQMYRAFTPTRDCWVHVRFFAPRLSAQGQDGITFIAVSSGTDDLFSVELQDDQSSTIDFRFVAGDGTRSLELPFPEMEPGNLDLHIQISTTDDTDDTLTVRGYRNEVLRFSHSAVRSQGWGIPDNLLLQYKSTSVGPLRQDAVVYFQDVIISDGIPLVGTELVTMVPAAVGAYNQMINDYSSVSGPGYDQSTVIASDATGQRESWVYADPDFQLGDKVIYGLVMSTVAQTDIAGIINDFQPFLRIQSTDYAGPNLGANNVAPDCYTTVWTQNPATNQPWTQDDLVALQAGLLSV